MITPGKDLVASSSVPLVLAILSAGESYGYEIIQKVDQLSSGRWSWSEGMLYPVLHKLEKAGMIRSYWKDAAGQRRRRYYRIEPSGTEELHRRMEEWLQVHAILTSAVQALRPGAGAIGPAPSDPTALHHIPIQHTTLQHPEKDPE